MIKLLKKFWKWIVATGIVGGIILAASQNPPDVSFETLPNVIKETAIYRITFDEYSDMEIKDQDMPEVKLRKWGEETFIKVSYSDFSPVLPKQDAGKLKWQNGDKEVHFYPIEPREFIENGRTIKQLEQGGFEFEIILKEKPKTNKIILNIETQGLDFFYQPPLTQKEIEKGNRRPENVIGSYAVYHKEDKTWHLNQENADKYKTGKAFHIYRPKIIDSNDNWTWGELNIDEQKGILTVTIPQDFLDKAIYPIKHASGLNFGYETAGSSYTTADLDDIYGSVFTGAAGTVDSITAHIDFSVDGPMDGKWAIYTDSNDTKVDETGESTFSTWDWHALTFSSPPSISAVDYQLLMQADNSSWYPDYDSGTNLSRYSTTAGDQYNAYPSSWSPSTGNEKYSIYCTYTPAAAARRIFIITPQ